MADAAAGGGSALGRRLCFIPEKFQLHLAMLALQFGYAGFHVVSRAALNMGISKIVFPVYRNILAFLLLLPFAYFLEKKERPPISWNFVIQFFLLAIVGYDRKGEAGQKGRNLKGGRDTPLRGWCIRHHTIQRSRHLQPDSTGSKRKGCFTDAAGAGRRQRQELDTGLHILDWPLPVVVRLARAAGPDPQKYPARLSFTSYQCFFGVIQFLVIAAFLERDPQAWLVHSGGELFSVFYAGVVASGIAFAVQIWCIDRGGPVFVAVYQPVQTLVVAIMASLALGEEFYLGGIIGAVLIITGLYFVLWGKKRGEKICTEGSDSVPQSRSAADQPPTSSRPSLSHSSPSQRRMFDQQNSNFNYSYLAGGRKKEKEEKKS
ncbi:UNVERIFIED_CONTAM: protein WALLS ARE THIN 1 [Sesamum radiatum]|uniref:WAT1-related protein n=1 Tax=Sesamum radiatum TaxID=300843 RepID=A0AAW2M4K5_SESRA